MCKTSRLVKICSLDCVRTAGGERSSLSDVVLRTLVAAHFFTSGWIMHSWRVVEFPLQGDLNHQMTKAERQRPSHMERSVGNRKARVIEISRGQWSLVCLIADWFWNYFAPLETNAVSSEPLWKSFDLADKKILDLATLQWNLLSE